MRNNTYHKGFTLIELLVVVAIIGFLSSIVLASVADARSKAQVAATIQQAQQYQTAMALCLQENGGDFPDSTEGLSLGGGEYVICISNGGNNCIFAGQSIAPGDMECGSVALKEDNLPDLQLATAFSSLVNSGGGNNTGTVTATLGSGQFSGLMYHKSVTTGEGFFIWPQIDSEECKQGTVYISGTNGVVCSQSAVRDSSKVLNPSSI